MKKLFYLLLLFSFLTLGNETLAQSEYNTAIGLRAGFGNGLTVKHFVNNNAALEGILYARWNGLIVGGLYEVHRNIAEVNGLRWFYGGGAHLGTWNAGKGNPNWGDNSMSSTVVGIDGIIGLDYKIPTIPINLSLDWKPAINFSGNAGFWGDEVALSIRYAF
jgi:hypothetical protein